MPRVTAVELLCATASEVNKTQTSGVRPEYYEYTCGGCGRSSNGRVVVAAMRQDGSSVRMVLCSCGEPSCFVIAQNGQLVKQSPMSIEFKAGEKWPSEVTKLFQEAAVCFAAGAYTATAMVCRKILMVCACTEGDADGKSFANYADYITNTVLTFPKAKTAIDKIRGIGNDANHQVAFVSRPDAQKALRIIQFMLEAVYSFPAA